MYRTSTSSLLFIIILFTTQIVGQVNDFKFVGAGARAAGMGNAFIGISDDATAISWNPAGLSQLIRPEASVVGRYTDRDFNIKDFTGASGTNSLSSFGLNFASLVVPFKGEYNPVIAASFQNQLDFGYKFAEGDYSIESNLMVNTASVAYSMKFNFLHAGLTVSRWFSTGDVQVENMPTEFGVISGKEDHSFSATSFSLGVLLDFENINQSMPLKIGARFSPAFDMDDEIEATTNDGFSESSKSTYEMPGILGFGLSYRVLDALTLAADYEMINIKDKKQKILSLSSNISESNENLNQYRVGAEYLVITDNLIIPLRAGYKNNPTLRSDIEEDNFGNPVYTDQVMGSSLNFGAGLIFNNIAFDVAYEYLNFTVKDKVNGSNEEWTYNFITLSGIVYF